MMMLYVFGVWLILIYIKNMQNFLGLKTEFVMLYMLFFFFFFLF